LPARCPRSDPRHFPDRDTINDIADRSFPTIVEKVDDLSTPGLRDGVEDIGCGCCSSQAVFIFLYRNICQEQRLFLPSDKLTSHHCSHSNLQEDHSSKSMEAKA
jgi:hypothetical protein